MKLILKYLRKKPELLGIYDQLQQKTGVQIESEQIKRIFEQFVVKKSYGNALKLLKEAAENGLFDSYIAKQRYKVKWTKVTPEEEEIPAPRAGHQMVIDPKTQICYLFGG